MKSICRGLVDPLPKSPPGRGCDDGNHYNAYSWIHMRAYPS
jgi:hypothetical protein